MILTHEQEYNLMKAVDKHIGPDVDPTVITLFRTSNKNLQQFWAFGQDARYISKLTGMTLSRREVFPWNLSYVTFSGAGFKHLHNATPVGTKVEMILF